MVYAASQQAGIWTMVLLIFLAAFNISELFQVIN